MPSRSRSRSRDRAPEAGGGAEAGRIFVGNITFNTTEADLRPLFAKYGPVSELRVANDRETGRSKGFAFVNMEDPRDAQDAIDGLRDYELDGRLIRVELSRPRGEFSGGRGGGRFGGGGRSDVCYDWLKNRCSRGSSCRFSHSEEGGGGGGGGGRYDDRDRGGYGRDRDDDRGGRDRDSYRDRERPKSRDRDNGRYRDEPRGGRDRSRDRSRERGGRDRDDSRDGGRVGRDRE